MSKLTDDKYDHAQIKALTVQGPTSDVPITPPPLPRTRRINVPVSEEGYDIADGAVRLKLATMSLRTGRITPEQFGEALTSICREWNEAKVEQLNGKGATS